MVGYNIIGGIMDMWEKILEYGWLVLVALLGGTVKYLEELRKNHTKVFSLLELVVEWIISGFAGLLTVFVCSHLNMSWQLTAFFAGISGHIAPHVLHVFDKFVKRYMPTPSKKDF